VLKSVDAVELFVYVMEAYNGHRNIFDRTTSEHVNDRP
jgi:hypothetical protein